MDCATERREPISEYFELEDQPEIKTLKTITEEMQKNIIKEQFKLSIKQIEGIVNQTNSDKIKDMWGEEEYESLFACSGVKVCFVRSLNASNSG